MDISVTLAASKKISTLAGSCVGVDMPGTTSRLPKSLSAGGCDCGDKGD